MTSKKIKQKNSKRPSAPGDWFQLVELFDPEAGIAAATPEGLPPTVVSGKLNGIPVVHVPTTVTAGQAQRISDVVQEVCGRVPLVITNNVKLLKLRQLSERQAQGIMRDAKASAG
jgi:NCAIR mutase (PurE)-related protein